MAYKFNISKGEEFLLKSASIGAAILGLVAVYGFYKNNIWKPRIIIKSVDYDKALAELEINNKPFILRGDSTYLIAYDWGVRFGYTPKPDATRRADRIEIIKRNMVKDVLRAVDDVSFVGM